jgi:uncharacterized protein
MKISLDKSPGNTIIAYDVGAIKVHSRVIPTSEVTRSNVRIITSSVIITPEDLIEEWPPADPAELATEHIQQVLVLQPEIVILGTGRRLRFPSVEVIQACHRAGAGFEVMDTGAACRTYNILAAEGRRVAVALLMIEA